MSRASAPATSVDLPDASFPGMASAFAQQVHAESAPPPGPRGVRGATGRTEDAAAPPHPDQSMDTAAIPPVAEARTLREADSPSASDATAAMPPVVETTKLRDTNLPSACDAITAMPPVVETRKLRNTEPPPASEATAQCTKARTTPSYPLTIYYDASCPLCAAEMDAIASADSAGRLCLVDCSAPGFADPDCERDGIAIAALMWRLHARDAAGQWRIGVPAFAAAYDAIGVRGLAAFWVDERWAPALRRIYGWLADHRQGLSRLGLDRLFGHCVGWLSRRAQCRAASCHDGLCDRQD